MKNTQTELNNYFGDLFDCQTIAQMENTQKELAKMMEDETAVDFFGKDLLSKSIQSAEDKIVEKQMSFLRNIL